MCSLCGGDKESESVLFEDILKQLDEGRKIKHENVEFTGGEPTVRPHLDEAVAYAKKVGYRQIGLSTNGRLLADRAFAKKLVDGGLTDVTIALHGPDAATHDRITSSPGSFEEIIVAIKNLKDFGVRINIASVFCRLNAHNFEKIGSLLLKQGNIEHWSISDMVPDGRGQAAYQDLAVSPEDLARFGAKIISVLVKFPYAGIFNFSRCVFPKEIPQKIIFFDIRKKMDNWDMEGKAGRYAKEESAYKDVHKKFFSECERCPERGTCGGFWSDYIEIYGEKPLSEMAKNSGLLDEA
jgi:MoaA/NifB/PqqE/SkfB family radical SAM enzyme